MKKRYLTFIALIGTLSQISAMSPRVVNENSRATRLHSTPLACAIKNNDPKRVFNLLKSGANPFVPEDIGEKHMPFFEAIREDRINILKIILSTLTQNPNLTTKEEFSNGINRGLLCSCERSAFTCAQLLVEYGADTNYSIEQYPENVPHTPWTVAVNYHRNVDNHGLGVQACEYRIEYPRAVVRAAISRFAPSKEEVEQALVEVYAIIQSLTLEIPTRNRLKDFQECPALPPYVVLEIIKQCVQVEEQPSMLKKNLRIILLQEVKEPNSILGRAKSNFAEYLKIVLQLVKEDTKRYLFNEIRQIVGLLEIRHHGYHGFTDPRSLETVYANELHEMRKRIDNRCQKVLATHYVSH